MKKRRIITVLGLSITLSLYMVACGKQEPVSTVEPTETIEATTEQSEPETTETKADSTEQSETEFIEESSETNTTTRTDYPDSRSDHQANWDTYKKYFDDFSVYGTDTAGKEYNDLPYCGNTGYNAKFLQERTTDKGYTVMYDTDTGKVYYSSMILPTGSGYDEEKSSNALVQYILDNDIFSVYDLTYSQFQEILGVYNGD